MCKYCNEPYKNMFIDERYIKIRKSKYSPSRYSLMQIQAVENTEGQYEEQFFEEMSDGDIERMLGFLGIYVV